MSDSQRVALLEKQLEKYDATALGPEQVAEVLGCTRRYVDKLIAEGKLEAFALDPSKQRKEWRVTKAALIAFMQ